MKLEACGDCGQEVDLYDLHDTRDTNVCDNCIDEYVETATGEVVRLDEAFLCAVSEEYHHVHDMVTCGDCGYHVHEDHSQEVMNRIELVCSTCLDGGDYTIPEDRNEWFHIDDLYYNDHDGCYYSEPQGSNEQLMSYDSNVFHHTHYRKYLNGKGILGERCGSDLIFGVELEMDTDGCSPDDLYDSLMRAGCDANYAIMKEDSTVSGLELVTLPCDLYSHKHTVPWKAWMDSVKPMAVGHSAADAGMHVHINRGAVSALTMGKMLVFTNAETNFEFLSMIAQRNVEYCSWCVPNPYKFDKVGKAAMDPMNGKYSMLNVTTHTIENRMFNANLRPERILKNIEFCHALVRFCETTSARQLTSKQFLEFVSNNRKEYSNLHDFIQERRQPSANQLAA